MDVTTADKVLATAVLMKPTLLTERSHEKKTNILHPSLKLICSEESDLDSVRAKVQQLAVMNEEECGSCVTGGVTEGESEWDSQLVQCGQCVDALQEAAEQLAAELTSPSRSFLLGVGKSIGDDRRVDGPSGEGGKVDAMLRRCRRGSAAESGGAGGGGGVLRLAASLEAGLLLGELADRGVARAERIRASARGLGVSAVRQRWSGREQWRASLLVPATPDQRW